MQLVRCDRCKKEVSQKKARSVLMEDLCKDCYDIFYEWFEKFLKNIK